MCACVMVHGFVFLTPGSEVRPPPVYMVGVFVISASSRKEHVVAFLDIDALHNTFDCCCLRFCGDVKNRFSDFGGLWEGLCRLESLPFPPPVKPSGYPFLARFGRQVEEERQQQLNAVLEILVSLVPMYV